MKTRMMLLVLTACSPGAWAQPHGGDVVLELVDGRIASATLDGGVLVPACTFESEMAGGATDEPGFDSETWEFPAGSEIGFTIRRALREWRGGTFDAIAEEWMEISWGPLGPVASPSDDTPVMGFGLGVSSNGEFHYHYDFTLSGPGDPGVYLLELEMWSDRPEIATSEPLYIIFNHGMDEITHGEAVAWWEANGAWCTAVGCVADFNGDGAVDTRDVVAFLNAWAGGDSRADVTGDGEVDSRDVIAFLNHWTSGC